MMDPESFEILGRWEIERGPQYRPVAPTERTRSSTNASSSPAGARLPGQAAAPCYSTRPQT